MSMFKPLFWLAVTIGVIIVASGFMAAAERKRNKKDEDAKRAAKPLVKYLPPANHPIHDPLAVQRKRPTVSAHQAAATRVMAGRAAVRR